MKPAGKTAWHTGTVRDGVAGVAPPDHLPAIMTVAEFAAHIRDEHEGALARAADETERSADLLAMAWEHHGWMHRCGEADHDHDPALKEPMLTT